MRVEAAAAVRLLSCVGLGLVLRAQLSQLRLGGGRGGGVFRLENVRMNGANFPLWT